MSTFFRRNSTSSRFVVVLIGTKDFRFSGSLAALRFSVPCCFFNRSCSIRVLTLTCSKISAFCSRRSRSVEFALDGDASTAHKYKFLCKCLVKFCSKQCTFRLYLTFHLKHVLLQHISCGGSTFNKAYTNFSIHLFLLKI